MKRYFYKAKIIEVYDGDTATAVVDLGFNVSITTTLRFYGINAPEMKGESREAGKVSRDFVRDQILNKEIFIETRKDEKEKYGRYLAILWLDEQCTGKSINAQLVDNKLAVPFMIEQ